MVENHPDRSFDLDILLKIRHNQHDMRDLDASPSATKPVRRRYCASGDHRVREELDTKRYSRPQQQLEVKPLKRGFFVRLGKMLQTSTTSPEDTREPYGCRAGKLNFFIASPGCACFRRRLVGLCACFVADVGFAGSPPPFRKTTQTGISTSPRNGLWSQQNICS